jgi:DUF4097 and DUF4098 domain-containing protein YvlB
MLILTLTFCASVYAQKDKDRVMVNIGKVKIQDDKEKQKEHYREERHRARAEAWNEDKEPMQEAEEVKLKLERGSRVVIESQTGDITVTGMDGDMLEARADDGGEKIALGYRVSGTTVYLKRALNKGGHRGGDANINVKLPRFAALQITVLSGNATISRVEGEVRANVVSGDLTIQCAKGLLRANSVSGNVEINGATGDVYAEAVSGDVLFKGEIQATGVYNLKSMNGEVEMMIPEKSSGFTATLTTFNGEIETDFPLKLDSTTQTGGLNRRIVGRFGDGQAKVALNSFNSAVRILKATGSLPNCK